LLTDADIVHAPGGLAGLVTRAAAGGLDLASLMVRLRCESLAERLLVPAFVFFFAMLYPFVRVNRDNDPTAAAAGGCMLVRRSALARIGGIRAIRGQLIDDCALAAAIKPGGPIWLGLADRTRSLRRYERFADIWAMIARTAYTQLRYSPLMLFACVLAMALTYLAPPVLALAAGGSAAVLGWVAWFVMSASYLPMLRYYGRSPLWAPLLPIIALFYLGATIDSARRHWHGRGGQWKGRTQAAASESGKP
jgi:hopene-associated glycosyltransferase HpnB